MGLFCFKASLFWLDGGGHCFSRGWCQFVVVIDSVTEQFWSRVLKTRLVKYVLVLAPQNLHYNLCIESLKAENLVPFWCIWTSNLLNSQLRYLSGLKTSFWTSKLSRVFTYTSPFELTVGAWYWHIKRIIYILQMYKSLVLEPITFAPYLWLDSHNLPSYCLSICFS